MSQKNLIIICLFVLLVVGIIVFVLVLKSKNNSKKKEKFDYQNIVSNRGVNSGINRGVNSVINRGINSRINRGINLDNTTVGTNPTAGNWLGNWPLTTPTQKINYVRTYGVSEQWVKWLEYLTDNKIYVFIGINSFNDVKTLIGILNNWKNSYPNRLSYIMGLSVANEPTGAKSEVQRVKNTAEELRNQLKSNNINLNVNVPITACFVYDKDWVDDNKLKHPEMYRFGGGPLDNVICFNIYGNLFGGTNGDSTGKLSSSLDWLKGCIIPNQISDIRNAMKGSGMPTDSQLWITEVGWTSEPIPEIKNPDYPNDRSKDYQHANATGLGWATKDTQKRFYNNFLTANDTSVDWPEYLFWFTVRDTRTPTKNESFGLLDSNGNPKFPGNPLPPCGSSCNNSCQCPDGTVCNNKSCISSSDCTITQCLSGYQCDKTTKKCIPILPDDCYGEGENPFHEGCKKSSCCPGTQLRLHPRDSTSNQPYYICSSNTSYRSNIPPKCDPKTNRDCLKSSFCKLPPPSDDCYENDEDVFADKCKKGLKCCEGSTFCRHKNSNNNYKYYCHKGNTCIPGDSKVDPGSSIFPQCPSGNCNVKDSKLCKYK
jgi:hypothetical protein